MPFLGSRIGPFEVVSPLGTGGMGEVCRARDTRLQRDGARLLLVEEVRTDERASSIAVVQNWFAEFGVARTLEPRR